jgi:hypothetical protein
LDGDSRSAKDRSSAKNVRVFGDDSHELIVSRRSVAFALTASRRRNKCG